MVEWRNGGMAEWVNVPTLVAAGAQYVAAQLPRPHGAACAPVRGARRAGPGAYL